MATRYTPFIPCSQRCHISRSISRRWPCFLLYGIISFSLSLSLCFCLSLTYSPCQPSSAPVSVSCSLSPTFPRRRTVDADYARKACLATHIPVDATQQLVKKPTAMERVARDKVESRRSTAEQDDVQCGQGEQGDWTHNTSSGVIESKDRY